MFGGTAGEAYDRATTRGDDLGNLSRTALRANTARDHALGGQVRAVDALGQR